MRGGQSTREIKNCGQWMEVADAEAEAALEAVKVACKHATPDSTDLWLCIDNKSVVDGINTRSDRIGTSQPTIDKICEKLYNWQHQGKGQAIYNTRRRRASLKSMHPSACKATAPSSLPPLMIPLLPALPTNHHGSAPRRRKPFCGSSALSASSTTVSSSRRRWYCDCRTSSCNSICQQS